MFHREWHEPSKALLLTNEKAARQGRIMFWQSKRESTSYPGLDVSDDFISVMRNKLVGLPTFCRHMKASWSNTKYSFLLYGLNVAHQNF
jgi:hypothetical protein